MESIRYNIFPCAESEVARFIAKIDKARYIPNGEIMATDISHYDRYLFLRDDTKVAVVYDRVARMLSVTGRKDYAQELVAVCGVSGKRVKTSVVPSPGTPPRQAKPEKDPDPAELAAAPQPDAPVTVESGGVRAKVFVPPERLQRRADSLASVGTVFASSRGIMFSADEIYPPQTVKKRALTSYGESPAEARSDKVPTFNPNIVEKPLAYTVFNDRNESEQATDNIKMYGLSINLGRRDGRDAVAPKRRATISFGTDEEEEKKPQQGEQKKKRGRPPKNAEQNSNAQQQNVGRQQQQQPAQDGQKKKRGRPPKNAEQNNAQPQPEKQQQAQGEQKKKRGRPPKNTTVEPPALEYKNGFSVKNFPPEALNNAIKRLKAAGKNVNAGGVEGKDTVQEVKQYTVSDSRGQRVLLRYATKRMTIALQGKRSDLFGEVMSQVSMDSDYSSALESYVETGGNAKKVSDVQNKLKKRLPTAYDYLSEQSRIDFSYCIHDFGRPDLQLSDYSVLLVPAFRGLERFVFDLQAAEGIKVKMIGQAFDKDDSGKYVLKSGYRQRIGSVIYCEVMVALYTEYFSQRNFFAHSDNTESNTSRSLPEKDKAVTLFNRLLDTVEYNAKKLKEIGFSVNGYKPDNRR